MLNVRCLGLVLALVITACASAPSSVKVESTRPFAFGVDTFAYANELQWEYGYGKSGLWEGHRKEPPPDYTLHCFVVVRDARQFFYHARFEPSLPRSDTGTYLARVREILNRDRHQATVRADDRIVIPGYANLQEFSRYWETLLKAEGGGAWQSFLQRGNWRMVFPFSRSQQTETAQQLVDGLRKQRLPIVHVVTFPERTIDHAVLIYGWTETPNAFNFNVYDPNAPMAPIIMRFEHATQSFVFPQTRYFAGGKVDAYEVYKNLVY